jgi:hypothetical protein
MDFVDQRNRIIAIYQSFVQLASQISKYRSIHPQPPHVKSAETEIINLFIYSTTVSFRRICCLKMAEIGLLPPEVSIHR